MHFDGGLPVGAAVRSEIGSVRLSAASREKWAIRCFFSLLDQTTLD
jgi:hypothetical protein